MRPENIIQMFAILVKIDQSEASGLANRVYCWRDRPQLAKQPFGLWFTSVWLVKLLSFCQWILLAHILVAKQIS